TPVPPAPEAPRLRPVAGGAPPTLRPVGGGGGGGGGSRARGDGRGEGRGEGERAPRSHGHEPTGMAVGPKVMLACLAVGLVPFLVTLLVTRQAGGGDDASGAMDAAGSMVAKSLASSIGG